MRFFAYIQALWRKSLSTIKRLRVLRRSLRRVKEFPIPETPTIIEVQLLGSAKELEAPPPEQIAATRQEIAQAPTGEADSHWRAEGRPDGTRIPSLEAPEPPSLEITPSEEELAPAEAIPAPPESPPLRAEGEMASPEPTAEIVEAPPIAMLPESVDETIITRQEIDQLAEIIEPPPSEEPLAPIVEASPTEAFTAAPETIADPVAPPPEPSSFEATVERPEEPAPLEEIPAALEPITEIAEPSAPVSDERLPLFLSLRPDTVEAPAPALPPEHTFRAETPAPAEEPPTEPETIAAEAPPLSVEETSAAPVAKEAAPVEKEIMAPEDTTPPSSEEVIAAPEEVSPAETPAPVEEVIMASEETTPIETPEPTPEEATALIEEAREEVMMSSEALTSVEPLPPSEEVAAAPPVEAAAPAPEPKPKRKRKGKAADEVLMPSGVAQYVPPFEGDPSAEATPPAPSLPAEGEATASNEAPLSEPGMAADPNVAPSQAEGDATSPSESPEPPAVEAAAEPVEAAPEEEAVAESQASEPPVSNDLEILSSIVESILFVTEKPVGLERLKEAFLEAERPTDEQLLEAIALIEKRYHGVGHGFELRHAQGGWHFVTKIENAEYIRRFQASKPFRLGRSALEVLAIIAYRQPITRAEIDQVRGIDSSHLMRVLMERGMVKMGGKADIPGRPVTYMTTDKFLEVVGLKSVQELPPLSELEQLQGHAEDPIKKLETNLDRVMAESTAETEENPDQAEQELGQIDTLIQSVHQVKEVYASSDAAECAKENEFALECFQAETRAVRRAARKNVVRFEDLQAAPVIEIAPPEDSPVN